MLFKLRGSLKAEFAVFPPSNKVAAMPDYATEIAICFCILMVASKRLIKNVLPVPPGASKKNNNCPKPQELHCIFAFVQN